MLSRFQSAAFCLFFMAMILASGRLQANPYNERNVLVLHSYHQGLEWTDNISEGILSVLGDDNDINLVFEYLDYKRNYSNEYIEAFFRLYNSKAGAIPFELVIVSDNAAYDFMQKRGKELYPGIPVVFCGVNNLDTAGLHKYPHFTGTGERADHKGTLDSILRIFPERDQVLIVNDTTLTGINIAEELEAVLPLYENKLTFEFYSEFTIENLRRKVAGLSDDYVIYLLVINRDTNGKFISYRKGITEISEVSTVPVFGSWDFYLGKGILGGKIVSGFDQGAYAGKRARMMLDDTLPSDLPQYEYVESRYIFDYEQMKRFGVRIREVPEGSEFINMNGEDQLGFRIILFVALVLLLSVLALTVNLHFKKRREAVLERVVEARTAELHSKNSELADIIENKDKFFSLLAHDLRNSVSTFMASTMLLNRDDVQADCDTVSTIAEELHIVATQTYGLLEDLLYWGMRQFKKEHSLNISTIDLSSLLDSIVERYKINEKKIAFKCIYEHNGLCDTDVDVCRFIFRNIIHNSLKFSHGGSVTIHTASTKESVSISISDQGIGMDEETISSILEKHPIRKSGTSGEESTGVGLSVALDFLELIGGKLSIESSPEHGSSFEVTLPRVARNPDSF